MRMYLILFLYDKRRFTFKKIIELHLRRKNHGENSERRQREKSVRIKR